MANACITKEKMSSTESKRLKRHLQLGKYRLDKRLGIGGYCEVWKARDCVEGIWVALKIPQADIAGQRNNQTIFREVRLVSRLRHPHIMSVKNAEIIDGYAVMATEMSFGTLDDCSRPMSPKRIISIASQVLQGLEHAHEHKILHCDVTPGNIFLFPDGHAAIGDFGIGLHIKGHMRTTDDYGTPGYVAPEQAYGHPKYGSDCFSVALILYEYITGYLPRWPFKWPFKKLNKLREKTGTKFAAFLKKGLSLDPAKRFANASQMLTAMEEAMPQTLKNGYTVKGKKKKNWKQLRTESFIKRYESVFPSLSQCIECGEPVHETMMVCPWCGSDKNKFDDRTSFTHVCSRCHKGMSPLWDYCPWCFGPGYQPQPDEDTNNVNYTARCSHCNGKIMRFMRYCPWCHRKIKKPWQSWQFPELCARCNWSIDSNFWNYCPWCAQSLFL